MSNTVDQNQTNQAKALGATQGSSKFGSGDG